MSKQKIIILICLLFVIILAYYFREEINLHELKEIVDAAGIWAPFLFMLIYILLTIIAFPVTLLTIASGGIFGPWLGAFYSLTGATIGATAAFILGRYIFRDTVQHKSGKLLKKIIKGVNDEGWQFVAFVRLVPLFPFNIVNFLFGLTSIRIAPYFLTSYICMLPGAIAYAYIGYLGSSVAMGHTQDLIKQSLLALAFLAIIAFIPKLMMKYRKKR